MKIDFWKVLLFFVLILALAVNIYPNHLEMASLFEKSSMYFMAIEQVELALDKQVDLPTLNQAAKLYETVGKPDESMYYYEEIIARNPKDLDAHINMVRLYQWNRQPSKVIGEYERFVQQLKSSSLTPELINYRNEAFMNLRNLYSSHGKWHKLIDLLETICSLGLQTQQTYLDLMDLYVRKRDAVNAIRVANTAFTEYPDNQPILEKGAWTTYLAGDYPAATEVYYKLVFLFYHDKECWFKMISFLNSTKQTARIKDIYSDMVPLFANDPETCEWLADSFFAINDFEQAIPLYAKLLKQNPGNLENQLSLANAYEYNKQYSEALDIFFALETKLPDNPNIEENIISLLIELKQYDQAQQRAHELLAKNPDDTRTILRMADIYEWSSQPAQAAQMIEKVLLQQPDNMDLVKRIAGLYEWSGNYEKAIPFLEKLLASDPDQMEYIKSLFSAYQSSKQTNLALDMGSELLSKNPEDADLLRQMSYLYMDTNNQSKAYEMLKQYATLQQPDVEILQNLAWLSDANGDTDASIGYYEQLLNQQGDTIAWARELGRLYIETGQTNKAEELIEKYKSSIGNDKQLQILLADIYIDKKQYQPAIDLLQPLVDSADDKTRALLLRQLADLYIAQEQYSKGIEYLAMINELSPDDMGIVEQLAYAYNALDQPRQSLHYFNILLAAKPDNVDAHYNAGYLNQQLHNERQARLHYIHALTALSKKESSDDDAALYATLYQQLKRYDHAIYWYTTALQQSPDNVELYAQYIDMLLSLELYGHVIAMVEKAPEKVRENRSVMHHLAMAYASSGQYDTAIGLMEQVIAQSPDNSDYKADLGFIFQKNGRWDKSIKLYDDLLRRQPPSWNRYAEIESEKKSLTEQYNPKLTTGYLLIDQIKKDTQMYYANFQMYLLHNVLLKTGVARYFFHDATLQNLPNVDDDLTEVNLEIEYFLNQHWSIAVGPLVINNSTRDVYTFSMGLLYNNFDNLNMSVRYSFRDKVLDPRVAIPLGGTSDHVDLRVEWQATPYLKLMADATHGQYRFASTVRRLDLATSPGYYNQMTAGADLSLWYDPLIALTYRYYWSDSHIDRNYDPLFNIASKNRSHQFGVKVEHQFSNNIFVYGTGFVANDDERDMFISRMGQYGIEGGIRCRVTDNFEIGGSYTFFSEKGIDAQPGRTSYINIYSSITF